MNPEYPVYIVSKGRWESRLTAKALEKCTIPYRIVIEPQEFEQYSSVIDASKILVLPFSNLGQGSIPARNWIWEHSLSNGDKRHWILDDNIRAFYRLNQNKRVYVTSGTIFKSAEDFVNRYTNIGLAGFEYVMFAPDKAKCNPFILNTRIYSCILIDNSLPFRWRGRYNEDTDLSLRVLKANYCTILFMGFLCQKIMTMKMKGGNREELYKDDGRLKMAQSLVEQHPDVVKIVWKYNRWQHQVDYSGFKRNKLILKEGIAIPEGVNNYGMTLVDFGASDGPS